MNKSSGPIRAVVAMSKRGATLILAHDSNWLASDMEAISDNAEDVGIGCPPAPGVWLWLGSAELTSYATPEGGYEPPESDYSGHWEAIGTEQMAELMEMEPPHICLICGKAAVTSYPREEDGAPSCGSPACELQMQAGMDYHAEAGDR